VGMGWDKDPELSDLASVRTGRLSPSPYSPSTSRYSSFSSPTSLPPSSSLSATYRRNSTIDLPILRQTSSHELPPSTLRRSSTLDRSRTTPRPGPALWRAPLRWRAGPSAPATPATHPPWRTPRTGASPPSGGETPVRPTRDPVFKMMTLDSSQTVISVNCSLLYVMPLGRVRMRINSSSPVSFVIYILSPK